ncbi:DNA-3-methyladenine glycosylase [Oryzifoliimicrobium ureilyticus]|uniref:DNA-3-methyladenine glycosylase n=1 Tax=Oryzifoliimicrobium ureilyticus TaxID=3113724 RepID=UPI00307633F1
MIGGPALAGDALTAFFARDAEEVARSLLGCRFMVGMVGGLIVETEAYFPDDAASHSFRGPSKRNAAMFGEPGNVYVYHIYGMHWCVNFVCRPGSAVLIRALEPEQGIAEMAERRKLDALPALCSGPGKLCQALGIDLTLNDRKLDCPPYALFKGAAPVATMVGPRIGITKNADAPMRFGVAGSRYLSKPFPKTSVSIP